MEEVAERHITCRTNPLYTFSAWDVREVNILNFTSMITEYNTRNILNQSAHVA